MTRMTPFKIYDTEKEEWLDWSFATLMATEDYIELYCNNDYERYVIYERIS